jgi:hypothetical protein
MYIYIYIYICICIYMRVQVYTSYINSISYLCMITYWLQQKIECDIITFENVQKIDIKIRINIYG